MNRRITKTKIHGYNKYYCPFVSICDNDVKFDGIIDGEKSPPQTQKSQGRI